MIDKEDAMNRRITCYKAIILAILFYAVLVCGLLWNGKILKKDRVVSGAETVAGSTVEVDTDRMIQQVFLADGGFLRYLDIYVTSPDSCGKFYRFMVYDETNEILYNEEILLPYTDVYPGYMRLPVGIETVAGRAYVWQLQGVEEPMTLGWQNTGETGAVNLGYYYSVEDGNVTTYEAKNILMRQVYSQGPSAKKLAALMGAVMLTALAACAAVNFLGTKKEKLNGDLRMQNLTWMTLVPVFYGGLIYVAYQALIQERFGNLPEDKLVYGMGIGIAALFFGYVFFAKRAGRVKLSIGQSISKNGMDWLQALAFAGVLWGCIDYMNAQYQFYQDCAYRVVLIWCGFLLLTMCPAKRLFGKINTFWLQLTAMTAFALYRCNLTVGEGQEALDAILLRYEIMIGVLAAIVVLALAGRFLAKTFDRKALNPWYAGLFGVLCCMLLVFRNTRGWPVYLVIVFVLFYLFYLCWEKREHLLTNFCNGVMLNFAVAVLFSFARRPFRAWTFARYNFVFHTVTVTATYLTLVICVLTIRLFAKLYANKKLSGLWGTVLLYGIAVSLLFLTMSRTGYLAAIAVTVFMVPFVTFFVHRTSWKAFLGKIAVMAVSVLLMLPVTYCGIRLLPVYGNDPYIFELEESSAAIHKDEAADSTKYMSVSYLKHMMKDKLLSDASSDRQDAEEIMLCLRGEMEGGVYVLPGQPLVASAGTPDLESAGDFSNGRLDIFKLYIENWNMTGHELMGVPMANGEMSAHAHNTYLQVIHDHGLVTGLVFVVFGLVSVILMFIYAVKYGKKEPYAALPLTVFIGFAVAGLVEWLFHPCNPIGFSVMVMFAPLLCRFGGKKEHENNAD